LGPGEATPTDRGAGELAGAAAGVLVGETVVFPGGLLPGCFGTDFLAGFEPCKTLGSADRLWNSALTFAGEQKNDRRATPTLSRLNTKLAKGD
jgi:hypothetical protein